MTRFLIHGNAPHAPTGYGVQISYLLDQLAKDGHEPAVSSTYGIQGGVLNWNGFRVYGCGFDVNSNDLMHHHASHWFGDEDGWIITVMDVWGVKNPILAEYNVAAWCPVDHFTAVGPQPNVREFFARTGAVPIAMSRFGEDLLRRAGLAPTYIPLSVDTNQYKPTPVLENGMLGRRMMGVPDDAFVVGMVAMNKGWAKDRKGFNEAFQAVSLFMAEHDDVVFYLHTEKWGGAEGQNLVELAIHAGIPEHRIVWAGGGESQYGLRIGYTPEMMAASYTGMDVLLAPSHGEGFCVPVIEAMACGTPVIVTDFAAQSELVDDSCGWRVTGQMEWDPALRGWYMTPAVSEVLDRLLTAHKTDLAAMAPACIAAAAEYDTRYVYDTYWKPFIAELTATPEVLPLVREPMPEQDAVAVLVPIHKRTENIGPLCDSFLSVVEDPANEYDNWIPGATLYLIYDETDAAVAEEVEFARSMLEGADRDIRPLPVKSDVVSCAQKWNAGFAHTSEPWVLCVGDDVRFHPGWLDAARKLSGTFDVIGTNDTAGTIKNPKVANGSHADHFFVRRKYVDEYGSSLEGPGVLAPEVYRHWYVDMEIIKLARARGVFSPCLDSVVEHLHPGYDGDEDARASDPTYMTAVEHSAQDEATFMERLPLIEQQRAGLAKL